MNNKSTLCALTAGIAIGWILAATMQPTDLRADDRKAIPKAAFLSGSERSVEVLERISKQISTMDDRLAVIEAVVAGKKK